MELSQGCDLLMDSGTNSCIAGKHTHILGFIESVWVSTKGYCDHIPIQHNLPIENVLYTYNDPNSGECYLLEFNHCIYIGTAKNDAIACPNLLCLNDVYVNDIPSNLFPIVSPTQCSIIDNVKLPLLVKGSLTYLPVQRPLISEIIDKNIQEFTTKSPHGWDPYKTDNISVSNILSVEL